MKEEDKVRKQQKHMTKHSAFSLPKCFPSGLHSAGSCFGDMLNTVTEPLC